MLAEVLDNGSNSPRRPGSTGDYLRQVRQIRVEFSGRPAEMQRRLKQLADARDREIGLTPKTPASNDRASSRAFPSRLPPSSPSPNIYAPSPSSYYRSPTPKQRKVLGVSSEVAELFATEVEAAIETGLLRFTERRRLIGRAQRLGMSRFDANLVIASVLNTQPATLNMVVPTSRWHLSPAVTLFLLAEAAIVGGAIWLLCH